MNKSEDPILSSSHVSPGDGCQLGSKHLLNQLSGPVLRLDFIIICSSLVYLSGQMNLTLAILPVWGDGRMNIFYNLENVVTSLYLPLEVSLAFESFTALGVICP